MKTLGKEIQRLLGSRWIVWAILLLTAAFTLKAILGPVSTKGLYTLTQYNNFLIFKQSFFHLIEHKSLYANYPTEHWDYYKYSPTFSLFFGICAVPPLPVGLLLWSFLNAGILLLGIRMLPSFSVKSKNILLLFIAPELFNSIQNEQCNAMMAGLMILTFALAEKKLLFLACGCIALSIYIKLFSAVALVIFIFYPNKIKTIAYFIFWMVLLFILPIVAISSSELLNQYKEWFILLKRDTASDYALSVMKIMQQLFRVTINEQVVQLLSVCLLLLPILRWKKFAEISFRYYLLASLLIWCVIFNHKAESPTFIISACGVAIWFFAAPKANWRTCLILAVLFFSSLSTTDLFPTEIKEQFFKPMMVKAWPCIVVWIVLIAESLLLAFDNRKMMRAEGSV